MNPYLQAIRSAQLARRGVAVGSDPSLPDLQEIPESEERSYLGSLGAAATTGIEAVGNVLDAPQDLLYGAILGKPANEVGNRDDEIEGRELLRALGLAHRRNDTWGNFAAGLAVDLIADPLNAIGVGALTKGGRAVAKTAAGARAGEYLTKGVKAGANIAEPLVSRATQGAARTGRALETISDAELTGRPFIRPRAAYRYGSIADLEEAARAGVNVPGIEGLSKLDDATKSMALQKDIGIGITPALSVKFNVPGGGLLTDLVDSAVATAKFSGPGRFVRKYMDKDVGGTYGLDDQNYVTGANILARDAAEAKAAEGYKEVAKLRMADDSMSHDSIAPKVFSEEGNRSLGRLIEKPIAKTSQQGQQDALMSSNTAVRKYMDFWSQQSEDILAESAKYGVGAQEFSDPNITGYLPRSLSNLIEETARTSPESQRIIGTLTGDQLSRSTETMIPGGRDFLAFELARDEMLVGPKRLAKNDAEAAEHIQKRIDDLVSQSNLDQVVMPQKDRMALAQLLNRLPEDSITGQPLFGQHPTDQITKYMAGRGKAIQNAKSEIDFLASHADDAYERTDGVRVTVQDALNAVGLKSGDGYGTHRILRDAIAKYKGLDPDKIELSSFHISQDAVNRMLAMRNALNNPEGMRTWLGYFTQIWRNSILTWPARYVRDLMGGFTSNLLETDKPDRLVRMYFYTSGMARGQGLPKNLGDVVGKMAHYADLPVEERVPTFLGDLMATGMLQSSKKQELGTAGAAIADSIPGYGEGPMQSIKTTLNPMNLLGIFNPESKYAAAGAQLGDFTDKWTRLAGYFDQMLGGAAPQEAARRMKRVHVDYSSLSEHEKKLRNSLIPFYTFQSRTLQDAGRRIVESPARVNALIRATQAPSRSAENDAYVPQYMRERTVLNVSPGQNGSQNILYNVDVPFLSAVQDLGNPTDILRGAVGSVNPFWKMVLEQGTGMDTFTRRPLAEKRGNLARAFGIERESPLHVPMQYLDRATEMLPGTRTVQLIKDLSENRDQRSPFEQYGSAFFNMATGLKSKNVTTDELLNEAQRDSANRLGGTLRSYTSRYIPKELLPMLPKRVQDEYQNFRQLEKMRQDRKKRTQIMASGLSNPG